MSRSRRKKRKVSGSQERPRLSVFKGINNIHAQVIDDVKGVTLASSSTLDKKLSKELKNGGNISAAKAVGADIAKKTKAKGITKVVFDRGRSLYHGRVKALADAAREGGLEF